MITKQVDTRKCEICGKRFVLGYGYSIAASWLVTGHSAVGQYMCEQTVGGQHWGCTPEHASEALQQCLAHDEHLSIANLRSKHESAPKALVAKDDEWMLQEFPNFPFVD